MSQNVTLLATVSPAQALAIEALTGGSSVTAAARAAGVVRETVSRWVHHDPVFIAELQNARAEIAAQTRCALEALGMRSVATLREALQNQFMLPTKLRAACAVLKMLGADRAETLPPTTPLEVHLRQREREEKLLELQAKLDVETEPTSRPIDLAPGAEPALAEAATTETPHAEAGSKASETVDDSSDRPAGAPASAGPGQPAQEIPLPVGKAEPSEMPAGDGAESAADPVRQGAKTRTGLVLDSGGENGAGIGFLDSSCVPVSFVPKPLEVSP